MPRKKSDRAKKSTGTFRVDRQGPPLAIVTAQAQIIETALDLKVTQAKLDKKPCKLTKRQKALLRDHLRVLADDQERNFEALARAIAAAAAAAAIPPCRISEDMSHAENAEIMAAVDPATWTQTEKHMEFVTYYGNRPCPKCGDSRSELLRNANNKVWEFCWKCHTPMPWGECPADAETTAESQARMGYEAGHFLDALEKARKEQGTQEPKFDYIPPLRLPSKQ